MKITVTDANIFIDLWELGWLPFLSVLGLDIHTTNLVIEELNAEQKFAIISLSDGSSLVIHDLADDQVFALSGMNFPAGMSDADKSVLWYAQNISTKPPIVLSGDKLLRNWCNAHRFEVHGILWVFDQMISQKLIAPSEANKKLLALMASNQWLPKNECFDRLELWGEEGKQQKEP